MATANHTTLPSGDIPAPQPRLKSGAKRIHNEPMVVARVPVFLLSFIKALNQAANQAAQAEADTQLDPVSQITLDAARYNWLRSLSLDTIANGKPFVGTWPSTLLISGKSLDAALDAAMKGDSA